MAYKAESTTRKDNTQLSGGPIGAGELAEDDESFVDLGGHRLGSVKHVEELVVVHLQQHTSNLSSQVGVLAEK